MTDVPATPRWLLVLSAVSMAGALFLIFVWVPTEATMGVIQRIFYFHVPAAIAAFCAVFVGGVASLLYLKTGKMEFDELALAANESVVVFSAVNIAMGSIWGRRVWGIWWTWDARLTSSLVLVLIYLAYLAVRKAAPGEQRATIGAILCVLGMADVPLIYLSNRIFRTQHPAPVMGGGDDSGLHPDMLLTFAAATGAMLLLCWVLVRVRRAVAGLERKMEWLTRRAHEVT